MASLETDHITVPGQNFALISVVGKDCNQKTESGEFGLKIKGCFSTQEEAASWEKKLQKDDATFDIYVVDMYKWLLLPPKTSEIEETHYVEDKLEEMMVEYRKNQALGKRMFEQRVKDSKDKGIDGDMPFIKPGDDNSKYYTKPDEPPMPHPSEFVEKFKAEFPDKPLEEIVKMADDAVEEEAKRRQAQREATD
jgi:hypothetical protein